MVGMQGQQPAAPSSTASSSSAQPPRPISAKGEPVRYLTEEQKAALTAKYGKIAPPKASELKETAQECKTQ